MTIVLSCINLKGGVGKTTLAVNFAAYCGSINKKTLLIDLDPQTNASFATIGVEAWQKHSNEHGTVADLIGAREHTSAEGKQKGFADVLFKGAFKNVDLLASHLDLFTVDLDMAAKPARERKLHRSVKDHIGQYDIVICDCPPNLTLPTQNALAFSTHYVVPVSVDFLSALGIGLLFRRVDELAKDLEQSLECAGIVISRVGRRSNHRETTETSIRAAFGPRVLTPTIAERSAVSMAAEQHKSVLDGADATSAGQFRAVASELVKRIGLK